MILDRIIGSARTEHRNNGSAAPRTTRTLLTGLLAAVLSLPSLAAWGADSPQRTNGPLTTKVDLLPLQPIPYSGSMPWMRWNTTSPTMKIDTLIVPGLDPSKAFEVSPDCVHGEPTIG